MENLNIEKVAKACHEANKKYCKSIGDNSQPIWSKAPDWQKQSAINGVEFHLKELEAGNEPKPEASHENWLEGKLADGWVYGEEKDPDKKTHPCCVPYDELPDEQKKKNDIFIGIVKDAYHGVHGGKDQEDPKPVMLGDDVKITPIKKILKQRNAKSTKERNALKKRRKKAGSTIGAAH